jgi:hypothetical protein
VNRHQAPIEIRLGNMLSRLGQMMSQETVQNLGVITPHFETDDVPIAPRRRNPC